MADTEIVDEEKTKLNGEDEIADETEPAAEQTKKKRKRKKKNKTGVVIFCACSLAHFPDQTDHHHDDDHVFFLGFSQSRSTAR